MYTQWPEWKVKDVSLGGDEYSLLACRAYELLKTYYHIKSECYKRKSA
jgi:hypothetical protein